MPTHPLRQVGTKYLTNKIKTYVNNLHKVILNYIIQLFEISNFIQ